MNKESPEENRSHNKGKLNIGGNWNIYVCYHGVFIVQQNSDSWLRLQDRQQLGNGINVRPIEGESFFLPSSIKEDKIVEDVPLSIVLDNEEIKSFDLKPSKNLNAYAATNYGSETEQDKFSNEDFSLAANILALNNKYYAFASVADGVSSKTFWSARSSRIVAFTTFKLISTLLKQNSFGKISHQQSLEKIKTLVKKHVLKALVNDKKLLLSKASYPSKSTIKFFDKHIDNDNIWYNTTLLFSFLNEDYGLVGWVGDGAVVLEKESKNNKKEYKELMRSSEDTTLSNYISLSGESFRLNMATLTDSIVESSKIKLYLASDGVDRTLFFQEKNYNDVFDIVDDSILKNKLSEYSHDNYEEKREIDNYSISIIEYYNSLEENLGDDGSVETTIKKKSTFRVNGLFFILGLIMGCSLGFHAEIVDFIVNIMWMVTHELYR